MSSDQTDVFEQSARVGRGLNDKRIIGIKTFLSRFDSGAYSLCSWIQFDLLIAVSLSVVAHTE